MHCANSCNGPQHGTCVLGGCECQPEWWGATCDVPLCLSNCSGHGACMAPSVDGARPACLCDGGWSGLACDIWVPYCPNECSAHGECRGGRCVCSAGFLGDDCAELEGAAPSAAARHRTYLAQLAAAGASTAHEGAAKGVRVVETVATRVSFAMRVAGALEARFPPRAQATLTHTLRERASCYAPLCTVGLELNAPPKPPYESTLVEAQLEVQRGAVPDAAAVVRAATARLRNASLDELGAAFGQQVLERDLSVQEGVPVFVTVAPLQDNVTTHHSCEDLHCNGHGKCALTTTLLCECYHGFGGHRCEHFASAPPQLSQQEVQALVQRTSGAKAAGSRCKPGAGQVEADDAAHRCV